MLLAVAGPPFQLSFEEALHRRSLPELIAVYLRVRQWRRDELADRLTQQALQIRLAGGGDEARHLAASLEHDAHRLRLPEVEPEVPALPTEIDRILRPYAYLDTSMENEDA